ncbi:putative C6 transcription factor [Microdochium trichocladiopsis]|uniref:C6 transcription factor n=1 Tax=Microdochium trichocladiopsis TaxID=1682393 RepID=A0A9P8Y7L7_9PEZI|nr:putative C6 transcription factor [Microdochium trichocladiopsis]KAH7032659.1 putative C6 transcription factor [Microdochium trichocladiopsis]
MAALPGSGVAKRAFRPIQPRLPVSGDAGGADGPPPAPGGVELGRGQRVACELCRRQKVKCDGGTPACTRCMARRVKCTYPVPVTSKSHDTLKRKVAEVERERDVYKQLFDAVRDKSEAEATEIYRRIRTGRDAQDVVRHIREGDLLLQLRLAPETRMLYTFPYLRQMPAYLFDGNPYLDSALYKSASVLTEHTKAPANDVAAPKNDPSLVPYHAAEVVDPRFDLVEASAWTTVIEGNALFVRLLQTYFQFEYVFYPQFHKDCFLDDMVANREQFCSPFLVNAILASTCHGHLAIPNRAAFWDPQSLQYRLLAECRRLFELEAGKIKLTNVQGAAVLSIVNDANACDEIGSMYLEHAVRGARALDLFSKPGASLDRKSQISRTMTAWGVFGLQAVHSCHVFLLPILDRPPTVPLSDPDTDTGFYGEIWLRYPSNEQLFPMNFGHSFKAISEFRAVVNEFALYSFNARKNPQDLTLLAAMNFRRKIMDCYARLPRELSAANIKYPHQLKLHMHYYNIIIMIFESVVASQSDLQPRMFNIPKEFDPSHILVQAKNRLEVLLRIYYLHHGSEFYDIFMIQLLSYTAFIRLKELAAESIEGTPGDDKVRDAKRSTIILAAKGLYDQAANSYLAEAVLHMVKDGMDAQDLSILQGYLTLRNERDDGARRSLIAQHVRSAWPIGVVGMDEDFEDLKLSNRVNAMAADPSTKSEGATD